jgi:DNA gyrase/topoisomerase IV subunit B
VGEQGDKKGTEVTFLPSPKRSRKTDFDFNTIEHRLRELAFLNSGVFITVADDRGVIPSQSLLTCITRAASPRSCNISTGPSSRCCRIR